MLYLSVVLTFLGRNVLAQSSSRTVVVDGFRPATDASLSTRALKYIPFNVPPGVTSIRIQKKFTWLGGPVGVLDQGLWDPNQFRGWQGGTNRDKDLNLTGDFATTEPHYIAGPLPAGTWEIAQSLLKSPPGGVRYRYTITYGFDGPAPPTTMPAIPKYDPGIMRASPAWFAGNLHVHTIYSDGALTLTQVAKMHKAAGYDFFAATDHNTYRQDYEIPKAAAANPGLLILYGEEITTAYGHSNVLGIQPGSFFDFRIDAGDGKYLQLAAKAHQQGGIIEVNHPYAPCLSCYWRFPRSEYANDDGIEVWNGAWTLDDQLSVFAWDRLLKSGKHFRAYGGSDFHRLPDALSPAVLVYAKNLSRDAIIDGLRYGHVVVSTGPHGPMIQLSVPGQSALPGDTVSMPADKSLPVRVRVQRAAGTKLEIITQDRSEEIPIHSTDEVINRTFTITTPHYYVRAELLRDGKMEALTNPIFVDEK